ncbi:MAG TPA: phosphoribosylformylglycinamidine synthase subunit PurS [Tepidiformaceae bacterium]|nr:phosphoribosylformylglycinamidine synthase subunit PurS [Tepidiformaceae bacterium]
MTKAKEKTFTARVYVSLKPTVNDPEGITIAGAISSLGFDGVQTVRAGKYFQLQLVSSTKKTAEKLVDQVCARLLANPVIETYTFEVEGE